MSEKLTISDVEVTPIIARAVISEAKARDVYDGAIPDDEKRLIAVGEEIVELAINEWQTSPASELKGQIGDDVKAILGVAGVFPDDDGELITATPRSIHTPVEPEADPEPEETATETPELEEPWDGYDKAVVPTILKKLKEFRDADELDEEAVDYVLSYERANKDRKAVIEYLKPSEKSDDANSELDAQADEAVAHDDIREERQWDQAEADAALDEQEGAHTAVPNASEDAHNDSDHEDNASDEKPSDDESEERHLAGVQEAAERFIGLVRRNNLPEPPQPAFSSDPEMPEDITTLTDDQLSQLYLDFNACLTRANWLLGLAQVQEVTAERLAKRARAKAVQRHKTIKPVAVMEATVELDDDVVYWEDKHSDAESRVKGFTKLASAYQGNVDRLSRVGGWRKDEAERAGAK